MATDWHGVLLPREDYSPAFVSARDRLADDARAGDWAAVLAALDEPSSPVGPNDWRVAGSSWFGPLHQAAWLGAPLDVMRALIERGAWRSLRDADGRRPVDIARARGHTETVETLTPAHETPAFTERAAAMSRRLAVLIEEAVDRTDSPRPDIRHLDVQCLAERRERVWFPIPGMYGGIAAEFVRGRVHVESWSRVVGGSGRAHVITADRTTLVDEGFV